MYVWTQHVCYGTVRGSAAKLAEKRGSEDRKIETAMIGRSLGIGMIGSDISCINTKLNTNFYS